MNHHKHDSDDLLFQDRGLDQVWHQEDLSQEVPFLQDSKKKYHFALTRDHPYFSFGSDLSLNFVAHEEGVLPEHASFVRDINGVRIIPIVNAPVWLNEQVVDGANMLKHGDSLRLGSISLVFYEYDDSALPKATTDSNKTSVDTDRCVKNQLSKRVISIKIIDQFFLVLSVVVALGVAIVLFNLA
jgi:hypothetical protein